MGSVQRLLKSKTLLIDFSEIWVKLLVFMLFPSLQYQTTEITVPNISVFGYFALLF